MSPRHSALQRKAAGPRGKTEVPVKVGRRKGRLDAVTQKKAVEIQRTCTDKTVSWCLKKLQKSRKPIKILKVPANCIEQAETIKKKLKLRKIKITNLTAKDR